MRRLALFVLLLSPLFAGFSAQAATSGNLVSRSNKCLDVKDGKFVNGGSLQLWDCVSGSFNQQWQLTNGQLKNGNKCLDVKDGGLKNGGQLQLWDCFSGSANQAWEQAGNNIRKVGSNFCLDVVNGNYSNGAAVQVYTCDWRGVSNQVWSFSGGTQARDTSSGSTSGATTFYGYQAVSIDEFMAKNTECAWIKDAVVAAAKDQGLNATFLATACIVESSCTVPSNGWGPFQFSDEGAWAAYGGRDKNRQNIWDAAYGAARYFKDLLKQTGGNLDQALRLYNGPISQGGNPRYCEEYKTWMSGGNAW